MIYKKKERKRRDGYKMEMSQNMVISQEYVYVSFSDIKRILV